MLILLPLQFVALAMRQWAATKGFSHSNYMGILDLCAAFVLIGLVTVTSPGSKWSTCIPKLWSVIVGNGRKTYLKSFSVLDGVSDMKKCWWQCHRKPLTSGRRQPDSSQRYWGKHLERDDLRDGDTPGKRTSNALSVSTSPFIYLLKIHISLLEDPLFKEPSALNKNW